MGVDYSTFIGPYVRCVNPFERRLCKRRACPNHECGNFGNPYRVANQKFCSECGSEVRDDVDVSEDGQRVDSYVVLEELEESFYMPGVSYGDCPFEDDVDIWIPNVDFDGVKSEHFDSRDGGLYDFTSYDSAEQIGSLIASAKKQLAVFEDHYGRDNVSIHWGVIGYAC